MDASPSIEEPHAPRPDAPDAPTAPSRAPAAPSRARLAVSTTPPQASHALHRLFPWALLLLITLCWDRAVYLHVALTGAAKTSMERQEWYIALRALGTLYPWLGLAGIFLALDLGAPSNPARVRNPLRRAVFLLLCPLLAGGAAEILKPIIGRYKPEETDGYFALAPLADRLSEWSDLGMASSHTAVAFGGAFALCLILPRGAAFFLAGAVGCGMTRLLAGGHFLSDVYVGVVIAYIVTRVVHAIDLRNNSGTPI